MADRTDQLGTRMKSYEAHETERYFIDRIPLYARIDGRAFHTFTRTLDRPFDFDLIKAMQETCRYLVKETKADLGYVQSDEISLGWIDLSKAPFEGRVFKLTSNLAGIASSKFLQECMKNEKLAKICENHLPSFDCRVVNLPDLSELANMFLWRELDAYRSSVNSVGQAHFSPKQLYKKTLEEVQEMLFSEKGINFNDYDDYLKRGSYFKRTNIEIPYDGPEIPNSSIKPGDLVIRTKVLQKHWPKMNLVSNKVDVYFNDAEPIKYNEGVCE